MWFPQYGLDSPSFSYSSPILKKVYSVKLLCWLFVSLNFRFPSLKIDSRHIMLVLRRHGNIPLYLKIYKKLINTLDARNLTSQLYCGCQYKNSAGS